MPEKRGFRFDSWIPAKSIAGMTKNEAMTNNRINNRMLLYTVIHCIAGQMPRNFLAGIYFKKFNYIQT